MNKTNPFFKQVIFQRVWNHLKKNHPGERISNYDVAKEFYKLRVTATHLFKDAILIGLGIVSAGFGLKGFLLPNNFIDGGVTGISLLTSAVTGFSLPILIILINLPFMILGYAQISRSFALKSIAAIVGLAIALALIEYPVITSDKLLDASPTVIVFIQIVPRLSTVLRAESKSCMVLYHRKTRSMDEEFVVE